MKRRIAAILLATTLIATVAACGGDQPAPSTPGQPDKVTVGVIAIIDVAPIYLGESKGFFSQRNIDLTLETAQGGAAIVPAVMSGQYQFGFSNVISLMLAKQNGLGVKVVATGVTSTGDPKKDFGGVVVKGDSTIQTPADLAGKKVATNTLKNIVDTSVKEVVRKAGGDPTTVEFVEMPFPDMGAALQGNRVDAVFVVEPFTSAALAQGGRMVSTWADVDPNLIVAMYFTSTNLIAQNPDLVRRFTEAIKESLAYADAHPDEVRQILGTYTQMTEQVRAAVTLPKWPADINQGALQRLGALAVSDGVLSAPPDLAALLP